MSFKLLSTKTTAKVVSECVPRKRVSIQYPDDSTETFTIRQHWYLAQRMGNSLFANRIRYLALKEAGYI